MRPCSASSNAMLALAVRTRCARAALPSRRPERQQLENIRRGQFEGIRDEIATNPARKPDFGGNAVHPTAGATVVGARKFLIAYNVFLNTPDVDVAKKVAKAVRASSGGLKFVKGAGFSVRGLAQVSMNLTDFEQTSIARVFEMVKREAARYGVAPLSSEIRWSCDAPVERLRPAKAICELSGEIARRAPTKTVSFTVTSGGACN